MKTIFEKIIDGELPCEKIYENESVIVIKDIMPKAAIHLLIITKKKIETLQLVSETDLPLMMEVIKAAQHVANLLQVAKTGYRLVVNNGPYAGQVVYHLHFHFLAGEELGDL